MKNLFKLALVALISACSHPIEIVGEGDVTSASGNRNCSLEDFQAMQDNCTKNYAIGAYQETYYATPRAGWTFDHWVTYCPTAAPPNYDCSFNFTAGTVQQFWGQTMPPLKAVFVPVAAIPASDTVSALGRIWAQPDLFLGLSWNEISAACPAGACPDGATLNGYDLTGWTWASVDDLNDLFNAYFGLEVLGPGPDAYSGPGVSQFFAVTNWRATEDAPDGPLLHALTADEGTVTGLAHSASIFVDSENKRIGSMKTNVQIPVDSSSAVVGAFMYRDTDEVTSNTVTVGERIWAQPDLFIGVSWSQIMAVCPGGVCGTDAALNGFNLNGWTFASVDDVNALFNSFLGADELGPGPDWYFEDGSYWGTAFFIAGFRQTGVYPNVFRFVQGVTMTDSLQGGNYASHGAIIDRYSLSNGDEARTDYLAAKNNTTYGAWFYRSSF